MGMATVAILGSASTSHATVREPCTKSIYSSGGKNYGKVICGDGDSAVIRHKAMATCRANDGRTWVAEGPFVPRRHASVVTCGTAKVTYVTWIRRGHGG